MFQPELCPLCHCSPEQNTAVTIMCDFGVLLVVGTYGYFPLHRLWQQVSSKRTVKIHLYLSIGENSDAVSVFKFTIKRQKNFFTACKNN